MGELSVLSFWIDFRSKFVDQVFGPRPVFWTKFLVRFLNQKIQFGSTQNTFWVGPKYVFGSGLGLGI